MILLHLSILYEMPQAPLALNSMSHAKSRCMERIDTLHLSCDPEEVTCPHCSQLAVLDALAREARTPTEQQAIKDMEKEILR